ncbi:hypothetical protein AB1L42_01345 [Thalassoglobus sp. JC818]|uniref:hypothetical protein n=1 Tax=Thalassoglobus sp. JC818 TaxID=3232136 RepID=UPI00345A27E6
MQLKQLREHFIVTDLERRLKADHTGLERDQILNELTEWELQIESQKRAGLSSEEFAVAERLLRSLRVSVNVVRETWNTLNTSRKVLGSTS